MPFDKLASRAPSSIDAVRHTSRKAFLDTLNGLDGSKRLLVIAQIAQGELCGSEMPTVRERLDANLALLYLQFGKPAVAVDVTVANNTVVRWDPNKYSRVQDLERLIELQRIGESE